MARDFTKNVNNHMSLGTGSVGALINGLGAVFVHAWVHGDTYSAGAVENRVLSVAVDGVSNGIVLAVATTGSLVTLAARSVIGDAGQLRAGTTAVGTVGFVSVAGWFDFAGDRLTPYKSGLPENGGAVTFGNAVFTLGTPTAVDRIGSIHGTPTTGNQFDGDIAEVSIFNATGWNQTKADAVAAQLALGYSAELVATLQAVSLIGYMKILGTVSPEPDEVGSLSGTIAGSLPQSTHPNIITNVSASNGRRRSQNIYVPNFFF